MNEQGQQPDLAQAQQRGELSLLLGEALPEAFDFYHLGRVELSTQLESAESQSPSMPLAMAYAFSGDARGAVVTLFDGEVDESACEELGNIIACRWASRQDQSVDLNVSSPRRIQKATIEKMVQASSLAAQGEYDLKLNDGRVSRISVLILAGAGITSVETASPEHYKVHV